MNEGKQGLHKETGVILNRRISPEGDISLLCMLRGTGLLWLSLPGGARGKVRLGGSTEPMVWGEFSLYRGQSREFLREIEVKRDFWPLRVMPDSLSTALDWCRLCANFLSWGHPTDEVLPVLFWSMDLLEKGADPKGMDLRFVWRFLKALGIAPSLCVCDRCGKKISRGSWDETGFICQECREDAEGTLPLTIPFFWATSPPEPLIDKRLPADEMYCVDTVRGYLLRNLKLLR